MASGTPSATGVSGQLDQQTREQRRFLIKSFLALILLLAPILIFELFVGLPDNAIYPGIASFVGIFLILPIWWIVVDRRATALGLTPLSAKQPVSVFRSVLALIFFLFLPLTVLGFLFGFGNTESGYYIFLSGTIVGVPAWFAICSYRLWRKVKLTE